MKKSILNIAITAALSSVIFSGSVLSTQAYANDIPLEPSISDESPNTDNDNSNNITAETYMYPGMGVGAATGALVAGPVGLLVGGIIGAFAGAKQNVAADESNDTETTLVTDNSQIEHDAAHLADSLAKSEARFHQDIQLAQAGKIDSIADERMGSQHDELIDILTADFSFDIYFRSGSSDIESFYPSRLSAVSNLMNTMNQLELYLDGYSDRRGDKSQNKSLAKQRIEKVREQLIKAGVDETRINSKAFGEMKMVSSAGDLEGYVFDRKVVIRFERATADSISTMASVLAEPETDNAVISNSDSNAGNINLPDDLIADTSASF